MNRIHQRRWLAGALAATLFAAMPAPVLAAEQSLPPKAAPGPSGMGQTGPAPRVSRPTPQLSREEALAKLKEHLAVPEETANLTLEGYLNTRPERLTWDFSMQIREGNGTSGYQFASVDATTGRILQYSGLHPQAGFIKTGPLPPAQPEATAREQAWHLVQQLYPEAVARVTPSEETAFIPLPSDTPAEFYRFLWVEHRGGVPMPSSQIAVAVDKATLEVAYLSYSLLDDITTATDAPTLTPEQAMQRWRETVQPRLQYRPKTEIGPNGMIKTIGYDLVYQFEGKEMLVDALTGAFSEARGPIRAYQEPKPVPEGKEPAVALPLGRITESDATRMAAALLQSPNEAQLVVETEAYEPGTLSVRQLSPSSSGTVHVNRETGLIRNAWRQLPASAPLAKVTPAQEEQAKQVALNVIQQFFSPIRSQLRLETNPDIFARPDNQYRRFLFRRYVNGVQAGYDTVQVNVDLQAMAWRDMYSSWSTGLAFPPLTNAITPDKALETFLANRKAELIYQPILKYYPVPMLGARYEQPTEAALVYRLSGQGDTALNAFTGEDAVASESANSAMDAALKLMAGHWAEGELRHMLRIKLLAPATLNPGAPLTRAQAVQWLLNAQRMGYADPSQVKLPFTDLEASDPAYHSVAAAYSQGWLRPAGEAAVFRPADKATRAEFAVWAMRILGLGDLARTNLAVQNRYSDLADLTAEQRNAANFLEALALIPSGEQFRGTEPITQAEAAALVVRLLNLRVVR